MDTTINNPCKLLIDVLSGLSDSDKVLHNKKITTMYDEFNALVSNRLLFVVFNRTTDEQLRFDNIINAMNAYYTTTSMDKTKKYILVHVIDIRQYAIVTYEQFRSFTCGVYNKLYISENGNEFDPESFIIRVAPKIKQIVPYENKQKMVFSFPPARITEMIAVTKRFFGDNVRVMRDIDEEIIKNNKDDKLVQNVTNNPNNIEMVIDNKIFNNYDDVYQNFQLFSDACENLNNGCMENVYLSRVKNAGGKRYTEITIPVKYYDNVQNVMKMVTDYNLVHSNIIAREVIPVSTSVINNNLVCKDLISDSGINLNDLNDNFIVYLIYLHDDYFKFGISQCISRRCNEHRTYFRKYGCEPKLVHIWVCKSYGIMQSTEKEIKSLAQRNNILVKLYNQTEVFKTDNVNCVIDEITLYVDHNNNIA